MSFRGIKKRIVSLFYSLFKNTLLKDLFIKIKERQRGRSGGDGGKEERMEGQRDGGRKKHHT